MCVCVCICQPETFCLSSLLRTRPHSLAPVLVCLLSTGVCGWLDRLCWFWSTQQCCSRRSHTEFRFTSETRISVIPNAFWNAPLPQCTAHKPGGGRGGGGGDGAGSPRNLALIARADAGKTAARLHQQKDVKVYPSGCTRVRYSLQKRKKWQRGERDAAMVSLMSLLIIPHWCLLSAQAHTTVSCQHLLTLQCDFHYSEHRLRVLHRERERWREGGETERERRGRSSGEWMSSCCHWAARLLQMLMDTPPKRGGSRPWRMGGQRAIEGGRDGWTEGRLKAGFWCSALTPCQPFPEPVSALRMWAKRGMWLKRKC